MDQSSQSPQMKSLLHLMDFYSDGAVLVMFIASALILKLAI